MVPNVSPAITAPMIDEVKKMLPPPPTHPPATAALTLTLTSFHLQDEKSGFRITIGSHDLIHRCIDSFMLD